jgi:hypothetical protein
MQDILDRSHDANYLIVAMRDSARHSKFEAKGFTQRKAGAGAWMYVCAHSYRYAPIAIA